LVPLTKLTTRRISEATRMTVVLNQITPSQARQGPEA
jgi:hypothetical protein